MRILNHQHLIHSTLRVNLAFLATLSWATGCGLHKPEAPNWTVDLLVPLANRHVNAGYVASHAGIEHLTWHQDSGLVWNIAAHLDTIRLEGRLASTPVPFATEMTLGAAIFAANVSVSASASLEDVTPLAAGIVPDVTAQLDLAFPNTSALDTASGATGMLRLEVENELGVPVDGVTISILAGGVTPLTAVHITGPIPTGVSHTVEQFLDHVALGNQWSAELEFHTDGGTVLSAAGKYIAVHASFPEGLTATYARGIISEYRDAVSGSLNLSNSHALTAAVIASGQATLSWTNNTPLPLTIDWHSSDLSQTGSGVAGQVVIAPWDSDSRILDLAGIAYHGSGEASSALFQVEVYSPGSNGQAVEIDPTQALECQLAWSELTFASATGDIAATTFSTGPLSTGISWPSGLEAAGLDGWEAAIVVASALPLSGHLVGTVTTNTGLNLSINAIVPAAGASATSVRIPLEHVNTPLRPLPSLVSFNGSLEFGQGEDAVTLNASDFMAASLELSAPAHIYVDSVALEIEPSSISLSSDDYGNRAGRLLHATVNISISNRFPLGGQFLLRLAADSIGVNGPEAIVFGPSTLQPAITDASGSAISARTTELTYTLDSAAVALFERDIVWFAESLTLIGPGPGLPARISAADVLDWHAQARMEVKLDGDVRPWEN